IRKVNTKISELSETIKAAVAVRIIFRTKLNHDEGMAWLRTMPEMLDDVAEVLRTLGPSKSERKTDPKDKMKVLPLLDYEPTDWKKKRFSKPSLDRESFVIDVLYEAIEAFTGRPLPSPRTRNRHCDLELVRLLVRKLFKESVTDANIKIMLGH